MGENEEKKTKKTRSTSVKKTIKNTNKKTADEGLKQAKTYAQSKPVFVAAKKDHKFIIVDTAPELENSNEKEINEENKEREKKKKIPVAIWAFFGVSLVLFCTAFYSAILLPKLNGEQEHSSNPVVVDLEKKGENTETKQENQSLSGNQENIFTVTPPTNEENQGNIVEISHFDESQTSFLFSFYQLMSEKKSDELLTMLHPNLRRGLQANWNSSRLKKFMDHVVGGQIKPTVIDVKNQNGTITYQYELHYSLDVNSEKSFDEEREMTVQGEGNNAKITNIHCSTHKCSQHPIFWPENFIK